MGCRRSCSSPRPTRKKISFARSTRRIGSAPPWPSHRELQSRFARSWKRRCSKSAKTRAFRKDWEDVVLEGNSFEQMFSGKEVFEDVKQYTDWRPEILTMYKRLAHEAPK